MQHKLAVTLVQGHLVREMAMGAHLGAVTGKAMEGAVELPAFQAYRDEVLKDSGNPSDPLEEMLLEQSMLLHHQLGLLHSRAAGTTSPAVAKVYFGAIGRLTGELRRLTLALRVYRSPVQQKQFTVVHQQNLAAGDQQVALVAGARDPARMVPENREAGELANNVTLENLAHAPAGNYIPPATTSAEPAPCPGRPQKPPEARSADPRRA